MVLSLRPARMLLAACAGCLACEGDLVRPPPPGELSPDGGLAAVDSGWSRVFEGLPGALISVWGTSEKDVWMVGSDTGDGKGALVLHYDGEGWRRFVTGVQEDLWWVHGVAGGPVWLGGSGGTVLRYEDGVFERMATPTSAGTVFGIWAAAPDDLWAVGGDMMGAAGPFVWRRRDGEWTEASGLPDLGGSGLFFKVWGSGADDVWVVGFIEGGALHYDGHRFNLVDTGLEEPLFTVHALPSPGSGPAHCAVGGYDLGKLIEHDGERWRSAQLPEGTRQLVGIHLTHGGGYAVGADMAVLRRERGRWVREATGSAPDKDLHAVWVDPDGGVWAVGGDVLVPPLGDGVLLHKGGALPGDYVEVEARVVEPDGGTEPDPAPVQDAGPHEPERDAASYEGGAGDDAGEAPVLEREPGQVLCGTSSCDLASARCCIYRSAATPPECTPATEPCPSGAFPASCDQPADCSAGEICCLRRFLQGGGIADVTCRETCAGERICASDAECIEEDECASETGITGYAACG